MAADRGVRPGCEAGRCGQGTDRHLGRLNSMPDPIPFPTALVPHATARARAATDGAASGSSPTDSRPVSSEHGEIQSAGFLLGVLPDWTVGRASTSAAAFLGRPMGAILGAGLAELVLPSAVHAIRNRLSALSSPEAVERAFSVALRPEGQLFDLSVHRAGGLILIEAEPSEPAGELHTVALMRTMTSHVQNQPTVVTLARQSVRLIQTLTGYDRVLVERFHNDLSGEVIAEQARDALRPLMGLRFPASGLSDATRALLVRSPVQMLVDADAATSPILASALPGAAGVPDGTVDLSRCTLRGRSLAHRAFLHGMGVRATLTVSLLKNGVLWGLIVCHHGIARSVGCERRTLIELFAQVVALLIDRAEREELLAHENATRQITSNLLASAALTGVEPHHLADLANHMVDVVPCDGTAAYIDGRLTIRGSAPDAAEFEGLRQFLERHVGSEVYATDEIGAVYPESRSFAGKVAGLLAIPISTMPRDYLVYFRKETVQTLLWAGDPAHGAPDSPAAGSQRFGAWQDLIHGRCNPWTEPEIRAARSLQATVLEVVLRLISHTEAERAAASQKQEMLIEELNHRVRNILGLIGGLISQGRVEGQDVEMFARVLGERVQALARAHDQITAKSWGPGSLETLIATEAGAYLGPLSRTIRMTGPDVLLKPQALSTLALVVHELITNAAKYGALLGGHGHVEISWHLDPAGALLIDWVEVGGPPVRPPTRRGFGSTIIEHSLPHELAGRASIAFPVTGVTVHLEVPAQHVVAQPGLAVMPAAPLPGSSGQLGGTVMVVEDNLIIALDAETMLLSLGAGRVVIASSVADALALIETEAPTFVLLDVNLAGQDSGPVAARLDASGIPYLIASGYGQPLSSRSGSGAHPAVTKPYTRQSIAEALPRPGQDWTGPPGCGKPTV